jgi:hypothetical protein
MSRADERCVAQALKRLYAEGVDDQEPGKFTIPNKTLCRGLGVRSLWPTVYSRLAYELGREGLLLVPFEDRSQVISSADIQKLRKLPSDKGAEIVEENPELGGRPAEILRAAYEQKFNRRNRGAFRALREDVAALYKKNAGHPAEYLTPERVQELADEMNALPLLREQKVVRPGYTLIDAGSYLAVIESKTVWRIHLCSDDDLESVMEDAEGVGVEGRR